MADICVFRLIENGRVAITVVVHVDDIFAVGKKERCDRLCADLNRTIPVKNLGDLNGMEDADTRGIAKGVL